MVMCKVEGCISNTIRANGYCSRHYYQINMVKFQIELIEILI